MLAVGKLLQELKAAGKLVLVITHDKELVTTVYNYQLDFAKYILNESIVANKVTNRDLKSMVL